MAVPQSPGDEAMERLRSLFEEARQRGVTEAATATLATADPAGRPSVRTVSIAAIDDAGPLFFVSRDSGKGRQLEVNPSAALCFFWPELHRQVLVEGEARPLSGEAADRHWAKRPYDARLAALVTGTDPLPDADEALEARLRSLRRELDGEPVPRPSSWKLMCLEPVMLQFWRPGWRHLRARERYVRDGNGSWRKERVAAL